MNLQDKTVLITGAAKRIGLKIAKGFAEKGAQVLIHFHQSRSEAESLAKELKSFGKTPRLYCANLLQGSGVQELTSQVLRETEGVDILVHNASLFYPTPLESTTESHWDDFFALHVKAPFFLAQRLSPSMKKRGQGRIIHISDWSALHPYTGFIPYCTSKAALLTLTQALAKALAPEILVNALCPGPILPTPGFEEEQNRVVKNKTLVGHWGSPEEISKMTLHLAESDFITGQSFVIDGGESLQV